MPARRRLHTNSNEGAQLRGLGAPGPEPCSWKSPKKGTEATDGKLDPTNQASQPRQRFLGPSLAKKLQGPQRC